MTHTPGPWHVAGQDSDHVWSSSLQWVADCAPDGAGMPSARANARLIAAAPDLLEALEEFLDCLGFEDDPVRVKARAAIDKARGQ